MQSGFYSSATGMVTQSIAMNHITDNLTNANVNGYKKQEVLFHSFDQDLASEVSKLSPFATSDLASGIDIIQGVTNFSQGALHYTGDPGDVALEGEGFVAVDTGSGTYYTRNLTLRVNNDGALVTKDGYSILNNNGEKIMLDPAIADAQRKLGVEDDGTLYVWDYSTKPTSKIMLQKIGINHFASPEKLERQGYGLWKNGEEDAGLVTGEAKFRQGYAELSNANVVENMVDMIYNQRLYDANANSLKQMYKSLEQYIGAVVS